MPRILKYCSYCKKMFPDGIIHFTRFNCFNNVNGQPCGRRLKVMNDDLYWLICDLNKHNYPVLHASLESNEIYILFERSCRFSCLPQGFDLRGVNDDNGEPSTMLYYTEPTPNKTPEELIIIRNQLLEWIKKLIASAR